MSENSIDIDVNFHIGEINKLFEKIMSESVDSDFFKELDKLDPIKGSLFREFADDEEKIKLIESLEKFDMTAPFIKELEKIMKEMEIDQDGNTEIIQSTQNTMMQMMTISKMILKMLEEKYPISDDMQKELDDMNDVLSNQTLVMDDKIDLLMRSMNNMFAPIKEELPRAFKITPDASDVSGIGTLWAGGRDKTMANISVMTDFIDQVRDQLTQLIERAEENTGGRIRLGNTIDQLRNVLEIADDVSKTIDVAKDKIGDIEIDRIESKLEQSKTLRAIMERSDLGASFEKIEEVTTGMMGIFQELSTIVEEKLNELEKDMEDIYTAFESIEFRVIESAGILNTTNDSVKELIKEVKVKIAQELQKINQKLTDEFYINTIEELFHQAIEKRIMVDPGNVSQHRKADKLITLANSILNRVMKDFEKLRRDPASRQLLEDVGLGQIIPSPELLKQAREQQKKILDTDYIMFGDLGKDDATSPLNMKSIDDMFKKIKDRDTEMIGDIKTIITDVKQMLETIKKIESTSRSTLENSETLRTNYGMLKGSVLSAGDQIKRAKNSILKTNDKLNEVIDEWNDKFGGKQIEK